MLQKKSIIYATIGILLSALFTVQPSSAYSFGMRALCKAPESDFVVLVQQSRTSNSVSPSLLLDKSEDFFFDNIPATFSIGIDSSLVGVSIPDLSPDGILQLLDDIRNRRYSGNIHNATAKISRVGGIVTATAQLLTTDRAYLTIVRNPGLLDTYSQYTARFPHPVKGNQRVEVECSIYPDY